MESASNLLGLYLVNPEDSIEKVLHAISFNKDTLTNMLELFDKDYVNRSKIEICPVKFYSILKLIKPDDLKNSPIKLYGKNKDLLLTCTSKFIKETIENEIYGFTLLLNNKFEECIINISKEHNDHLEYIKSTSNIGYFSENPIKFDTLYEEGIMNC